MNPNTLKTTRFHTIKFFWNSFAPFALPYARYVSTLLSSSETLLWVIQNHSLTASFHTIKFFWNYKIPHRIYMIIPVSTLLSSSETIAYDIQPLETVYVSTLLSSSETQASHPSSLAHVFRFHTIKFFWNIYSNDKSFRVYSVSTLLSSSET